MDDPILLIQPKLHVVNKAKDSSFECSLKVLFGFLFDGATEFPDRLLRFGPRFFGWFLNSQRLDERGCDVILTANAIRFIRARFK